MVKNWQGLFSRSLPGDQLNTVAVRIEEIETKRGFLRRVFNIGEDFDAEPVKLRGDLIAVVLTDRICMVYAGIVKVRAVGAGGEDQVLISPSRQYPIVSTQRPGIDGAAFQPQDILVEGCGFIGVRDLYDDVA